MKYLIFIIFLIVYSQSYAQAVTEDYCKTENIDCAKQVNLKNFTLPTYHDEKHDACCSRLFLKKVAPNGMVTIFGSARLKAGTPAYELVREFARKWTEQDSKWPIASGGGSGLMEAANRGAREAKEGKGVSIGLGVYFDNPNNLKKPNQYIPQGYSFVYRNLTKREGDLIDHAQAIVIGAGGTGTEWEIMETLAKLQTFKKPAIPIILLGPEEQWQHFLALLKAFADRGTLDKNDCKYMNITNSADKAVKLILMDQAAREKDASSVCFTKLWKAK